MTPGSIISLRFAMEASRIDAPGAGNLRDATSLPFEAVFISLPCGGAVREHREGRCENRGLKIGVGDGYSSAGGVPATRLKAKGRPYDGGQLIRAVQSVWPGSN